MPKSKNREWCSLLIKNILLTQSFSRGIEKKRVPKNTNHEYLIRPMLSLPGIQKDLRTFDRVFIDDACIPNRTFIWRTIVFLG